MISDNVSENSDKINVVVDNITTFKVLDFKYAFIFSPSYIQSYFKNSSFLIINRLTLPATLQIMHYIIRESFHGT